MRRKLRAFGRSVADVGETALFVVTSPVWGPFFLWGAYIFVVRVGAYLEEAEKTEEGEARYYAGLGEK